MRLVRNALGQSTFAKLQNTTFLSSVMRVSSVQQATFTQRKADVGVGEFETLFFSPSRQNDSIGIEEHSLPFPWSELSLDLLEAIVKSNVGREGESRSQKGENSRSR